MKVHDNVRKAREEAMARARIRPIKKLATEVETTYKRSSENQQTYPRLSIMDKLQTQNICVSFNTVPLWTRVFSNRHFSHRQINKRMVRILW